jgi:pimeloyl-ACP methyl ester carboxylesterase
MTHCVRSSFSGRPRMIVTATLVAMACCYPAMSASEQSPLVIAKQGWMYVGGHVETFNGKQYMTGQMYVEYQLPANKTHAYPLILVHSGLSGVNYTGTPDGREGWAQYFLRHGFAVYIIDQPGRGRSRYMAESYGPLEQPEADHLLTFRYVAPEKSNLYPQAHLHTQWPGGDHLDDPVVQQLVQAELSELKNTALQSDLNRKAILALLEKIGPATLMVYSQTGNIGWPIADAKPELVKFLIEIEPNGPPAYAVDYIGPPSYFKYGGLSRAYGISTFPLTYSPPLSDQAQLSFVQQEIADRPDLVRCYSQKDPARQLTNLQKMPILILTSEASYHAPYDHCTVKYLEQAGVHPTFIRLADRGIHGIGHAMMLEKNNQQVAAVIAQWLDKAESGALRNGR